MIPNIAVFRSDIILIPTLELARIARDEQRYFQADYLDLHRRFSQISSKYPILHGIPFEYLNDKPFSPELSDAFDRLAQGDYLLWDGENEIFFITPLITEHHKYFVQKDVLFSEKELMQLLLIGDDLIKPFKSFTHHPSPD